MKDDTRDQTRTLWLHRVAAGHVARSPGKSIARARRRIRSLLAGDPGRAPLAGGMGHPHVGRARSRDAGHGEHHAARPRASPQLPWLGIHRRLLVEQTLLRFTLAAERTWAITTAITGSPGAG